MHCTVASVTSQGRDGMHEGVVDGVVMLVLLLQLLPEVCEDEGDRGRKGNSEGALLLMMSCCQDASPVIA